MFEAFGKADNELVLENNRYHNFERDAENLLNNLRESSNNSLEGSKREQTELEYRRRAERQRLEQKLAELNAKQLKKDSQ